ncbi:hypothetical protein Fmac_024972 [Flemingia macrophylla]|uniref:Uncharacterized protein n=1 Tax=Flemingia macrophylla TaxID=520843 RepID=A0ABD1LQW5_9FABA
MSSPIIDSVRSLQRKPEKTVAQPGFNNNVLRDGFDNNITIEKDESLNQGASSLELTWKL